MNIFKPQWEKDWKKDKPKTLLSEPLTPALAALDRGLAGWAGEKDDDKLAELIKLTEAAIKAAPAAKAKCNKTLHKEGMVLIDSIGKDLAVLLRELRELAKKMQVYMTHIRKGIVAQRQIMLAVIANPSLKLVKAAEAQSSKVSNTLDAVQPPFRVDTKEMKAVPPLFAMPPVMLGSLCEALEAKAAAGADAKGAAKADVKIAGLLGELKKQAGKAVDKAFEPRAR